LRLGRNAPAWRRARITAASKSSYDETRQASAVPARSAAARIGFDLIDDARLDHPPK
jgi:hypothetical protein